MTEELNGGCLDEREAFEAWIRTREGHPFAGQFANLMWAAWLARSASRQEGWISVEERLPGEQGCDSEEVLCFLSGHCAMTDFACRDGAGWGVRLGFYDAEKGMFRTHGRPDDSVTHWRPLPASPHQAQEAQGDRHGE